LSAANPIIWNRCFSMASFFLPPRVFADFFGGVAAGLFQGNNPSRSRRARMEALETLSNIRQRSEVVSSSLRFFTPKTSKTLDSLLVTEKFLGLSVLAQSCKKCNKLQWHSKT